jgi:hypothetical protein
LDEVVHEDIGDADWSLKWAIGRWGDVFRLRKEVLV